VIAKGIAQTLRALPEIPEEDARQYQQWFGKMCAFAWWRQMYERNQPWHLRPSGQKCPTAEAFKKLGVRGNDDTAKHGTFLLGDLVENFTLSLGLMGGYDLHSFQKEVRIPLPNGKWTVGHIDALYTVGDKTYLLDVKSANAHGYKEALNGLTADLWGYKRQLKTYKLSPDLDGTEDASVLLYCNKETGRDFTEVLVPGPTAQDKKEWFDHCRTVDKAREEADGTLVIPARPTWATTNWRPKLKLFQIADPRCRYCDLVQECWGDHFKERSKGKKDWHSKKKPAGV
jgi:hypothetical protein